MRVAMPRRRAWRVPLQGVIGSQYRLNIIDKPKLVTEAVGGSGQAYGVVCMALGSGRSRKQLEALTDQAPVFVFVEDRQARLNQCVSAVVVALRERHVCEIVEHAALEYAQRGGGRLGDVPRPRMRICFNPLARNRLRGDASPSRATGEATRSPGRAASSSGLHLDPPALPRPVCARRALRDGFDRFYRRKRPLSRSSQLT